MNILRMGTKGQMAIFIALIFQLLFVFFAMVINIGLLVHEKINLQNSVDIAAIYGAQKQAEVLNAIAHQNYQIRQAWKLLAFRVYVLGDIARSNHPSGASLYNRRDANQIIEMGEEINPYYENPDDDKKLGMPVVCVDHGLWSVRKSSSNVCREAKQYVPPIAKAPIIFPLLPINQITTDFAKQQQEFISRECEKSGPMNWQMAALWYAGFKSDVKRRKNAIQFLAQNMSENYFNEISGGSVIEGIRKTLQGNLTRGIRQNVKLNFKNSLSGVASDQWLKAIDTLPLVPFLDSISQSGCTYLPRFINAEAGTPHGEPHHGLRLADPNGELKYAVMDQASSESFNRAIAGYEKNPWYMAYVMVEAETTSGTIFSPFGKGVKLKARSFAMPFGGRIGPWYANKWPRESVQSVGEKIDLVGPTRYDGRNFGAEDPRDLIPNFSKYPGDKLGLKSNLALSMLRSAFESGVGSGKTISPESYSSIVSSNPMEPGPVDSLASLQTPDGPSWVRPYEIFAVAPNLFDITYYSIDPRYYTNYVEQDLNKLRPNYFYADLGFNTSDQGLIRYSVENQIRDVSGFPDRGLFSYIVQDTKQLLTSWVTDATLNYQFPEEKFLECNTWVSEDVERRGVSTPGSCLSGGRTGYSVKIVNQTYLESGELELGGEGIKGPILNPPPE